MRLVIQRVSSASVAWDEGQGRERRAIGRGVVALVAAGPGDEELDVERLADKLVRLRIFADEEGRTNLSLQEVQGEALVVSQFTLYADLSRGRRPGFTGSGDPARAAQLCERFAQRLEAGSVRVERGRFGAKMQVEIVNDGPFTLVFSSDDWPTCV